MGLVGQAWLFAENAQAQQYLDIPGYKMDFKRETAGSVDYIRRQLVPAGKPVEVFQWSGDTAPNEAALKASWRSGSGEHQRWRHIHLQGTTHADGDWRPGHYQRYYLQVYAPITNENIYTNLWQGPLRFRARARNL